MAALRAALTAALCSSAWVARVSEKSPERRKTYQSLLLRHLGENLLLVRKVVGDSRVLVFFYTRREHTFLLRQSGNVLLFHVTSFLACLRFLLLVSDALRLMLAR